MPLAAFQTLRMWGRGRLPAHWSYPSHHHQWSYHHQSSPNLNMNDRRYDHHNQHWLTHYTVRVFKMIEYFRHFDMVENLLQRRRSRKWDKLEKKLAGNWRERKSTRETFEKKLGRTITVKEFRRWKLEVWSGHWKAEGVVWGKRRELVEWEERGNGIKQKWRTEQKTHSKI